MAEQLLKVIKNKNKQFIRVGIRSIFTLSPSIRHIRTSVLQISFVINGFFFYTSAATAYHAGEEEKKTANENVKLFI